MRCYRVGAGICSRMHSGSREPRGMCFLGECIFVVGVPTEVNTNRGLTAAVKGVASAHRGRFSGGAGLVAPTAIGAPELDAIAPRCAAEPAVAADAVAAGTLV